jgi:hypothetical protein
MSIQEIGKKIIDIKDLVDIFEAQEGEIQQIIGKTGNGKTYEGTRRALEYLKQGKIVYTTWHMILPEYYDERNDKGKLLFNLFLFRKNFYKFNFKENWKYLDIDRPDLTEFISNLTDCIVFLDEGQDVFDSYEGKAMSSVKRKSLTRTRHLRKTLIIISQRAQAVAVTARANVTFFYKCVKSWAWFFPFKTYFKVYRTEEMDDQNFPIWEKPLEGWKAELWHSAFADSEVYNAYNSWYLREGITKSQEIYFEAYTLNTLDKIVSLFKKKEIIPLAYSYEEMVKKAKEKQAEHKIENEILTRKVKGAKKEEVVNKVDDIV